VTVWITKVWGIGETVGPLLFSTEGWRRNAREKLQPGDLVVLVGTLGPETAEADRNWILGMMEPTDEPVMALDFLQGRGDGDYNERGEYKWPYGLLNKRAWHFDAPRTRLSDISGRPFSMEAALGIVPLFENEAERVLALPRTPARLAQSVQARARIEGDRAVMKRSFAIAHDYAPRIDAYATRSGLHLRAGRSRAGQGWPGVGPGRLQDWLGLRLEGSNADVQSFGRANPGWPQICARDEGAVADRQGCVSNGAGPAKSL